MNRQSGGVLQTYQQDLKEFGLGLKKETETITGVTAHVVKDLPASLETGATVAQVTVCHWNVWCNLVL